MHLVLADHPPAWLVTNARGTILRRATQADVVAAGASLGGAPWTKATPIEGLDGDVAAMAHIVACSLAHGHRRRVRRIR